MIDFSAPRRPSRRLQLGSSLSQDGIHIVPGALAANNDGIIIGGSQLSIAIQIGGPIDLEWSTPPIWSALDGCATTAMTSCWPTRKS
ncbi:hypothetical protein [Novosphingobium resinovorum]|uniref:hypothetical protein n=1 Tax=Novosphingobium resinovorum TaxID=158500 RepID=UPI002ED041A3|nr:hypothetical protein [Novosphingobium resinovorum]